MKKIRLCKYCGNQITKRHNKNFCSLECRDNYRKEHSTSSKSIIMVSCPICGKEYETVRNKKRRKACSKECAKELVKRTNFERYGNTNPAQNSEVRKKISEALNSRSKEDKRKTEEKKKVTFLEKYGVEHALQNNEIKEKAKQTWIEKYGVDNPLKSKEVQDKVKQTYLERYGDENPFKTENFKKKASQTWLEKYGIRQIAQSKEKNIKTKQTKLEKYGSSTYNNIEKAQKTNLKRYGVDNPLKSKEIQEKAQKTNLKRYGVLYNCMTSQCRDASPVAISKINLEFNKFLNNNGYKTELEFTIGKFSYDIHILNTNILIEIDPAYTHNSTVGPQYNKIQLKPKDKYYHYNKTKLALENNYICIHKFNWNTKDQILKAIKKIQDDSNIKQEEPRLHYYNMKTRRHIKGVINSQLLDQGFVEIYDDGIILK